MSILPSSSVYLLVIMTYLLDFDCLHLPQEAEPVFTYRCSGLLFKCRKILVFLLATNVGDVTLSARDSPCCSWHSLPHPAIRLQVC
jgi:hypothetical protein